MLPIALSLAASAAINQRELPHRFPVGMFGVYAGAGQRIPQPGTDAFRRELTDICRGKPGGYEGCNLLQTYNFYIDRAQFWSRYLSDIDRVRLETGVDLKTLVNVRWPLPDSDRDNKLSTGELASFEAHLSRLLADPNAHRIGGWFLADEPTRQGHDPVSLERLYHAIKARDSRPVFVCDQRIGVSDYSRYRCDILMIDYYDYIVNRTDSLTLQAWNAPIRKARRDLTAVGRGNTAIHAILVLGKPFGVTTSHGMTHAAIRKVLDLGFEGLWFYGWRTSPKPDQYALTRWIGREGYAEVVENELHDTDSLAVAVTRADASGESLYRIGAPEGNFPDALFRSHMVHGEDTPAGYRIVALSAGDLAGEMEVDTAWFLHNRSTADGDDGLAVAFSLISGKARPLLRITGAENGNRTARIETAGTEVTAMTCGDFDGDGDHELVTAVRVGKDCRVLIGNSNRPDDLHLIWKSEGRRVTALTAGSFRENDPGRDFLVMAVSEDTGNSHAIYLSDPGRQGPLDEQRLWSGTIPVTALSAGCFMGWDRPRDRLSVVFADTLLCIGDIGRGESPAQRVIRSGSRRITALAAGDFSNDCRNGDFLVLAENNSHGGSDLVLWDLADERPSVRSRMSFEMDRITALAAGSFRESLHPAGER